MMQDEKQFEIVSIEDEMSSSFLEYSMSVIVARALPDVRDGLKPVHRRILYAMYTKGNRYDKSFRKSAASVGEVMASYHPHGDSSIYDALVRMAQDFSLMYPLIESQGNFGSIDGDPPAAMRYTEARLSKIADHMLYDIEKNTVDFTPNYDESKLEPKVLPGKIPNLIINGSGGIAVGMTTNIPSHNLGEVIDAIIYLIDNKDASIDDLLKFIKGPDFPTAGTIYGRSGLLSFYHTGRGHIILRGEAEIEKKGNKTTIAITELPYQVNKAKLVEKVAELVRDKKITGISDLRDESNKDGIRIAVDLKRDANESVILNQIYTHTSLQSTFGAIFLALVNGRPVQLNLKEALFAFIDHRIDVIKRRTLFDLEKTRQRWLILKGLLVAINNLDKVIAIIRESDSPPSAKSHLIREFSFSELQAKAILEMRLQRLTALERNKVESDLNEAEEQIKVLENIRDNEDVQYDIIKSELKEIRSGYATERKTRIEDVVDEILSEDLIERENVICTISMEGYIKRISVKEFKAQRRGGKGVIGMGMKDQDVAADMFSANSHDYLLIFTNRGRVFSSRVFEASVGSRVSKGRSINNLVQLKDDETVARIFPIKEFSDNHFLLIATKSGIVKKTKLSAYSKIHSGGIVGVELRDDDEVIEAKVTTGDLYILLSTKKGMAIMFAEDKIRDMGRKSIGVIGIRLSEDDEVVGMITLREDEMKSKEILTIKENGLAKRTSLDKYRVQGRGGLGLIDIKTDDADVVSSVKVDENDQLMIITDAGVVIRIRAKEISSIGRNTKGVKGLSFSEGSNKVVSIARLAREDEISLDTEFDLEN